MSIKSEYLCDSNTNYIAKAMSATTGWWYNSTYQCAVGNDLSANNATGFSAVPAGSCSGSLFYRAGNYAYFWSSSQDEGDPDYAYDRYLYSYNAYVNRSSYLGKYYGRSVRCLRDNRSVGDYLQGVSEQIEAQQSVVDSMRNVLDSLAPVAFSGDYNDLTNTPPIPAAQVNSDWNATSGVEEILNKPTNVSAFNNDAGYITMDSVPTNVSAFNNDAGYLTSDSLANLSNQLDSLQQALENLQQNMPFTCGVSTVSDHEGNLYHTVKIGDQCWTKENLRTTTSPSTGTYLIPVAGTDYTYTGKQARWYNDDSTTYAPMNYGLLYNWNAAVDTFNTSFGETSVNQDDNNAVSVTFDGHRRGICPEGWHLPSDAEWNAMERTVSDTDWQASYETATGWRGNHAGKLAGGDNWYSRSTTGAPGDYSNAARNSSGFSAVPAGSCSGSSFSNAGDGAYFWSSSQSGDNPYSAYDRSLYYYYAIVYRYCHSKYYGFSVRCLRDNRSVGDYLQGVSEQIEAQQSVVDSMQNVLDSLAPVAFSGDYNDLTNTPPIPAAQVNADWNATSGVEEILNKPTNVSAFNNDAGYLTSDSLANLNNQLDSLQQALENLQQTVEDDHFVLCPSTVTDHEGNVYHTVKIGDQCWTKENLRTTTSPSTGTYLIPASGTGDTYTGKQAFWYNNDSTTYAPLNYGLLYNWNAAVDTFNTAYGETSVNQNFNNAVSVTFNSPRRGICPEGWHLPSDAEWTAMTNYVGSVSEYQCDGSSSYIAKALASETGWNSFSGECYPGDQSVTANNATGFSAVPAGYCGGSSFDLAGYYAYFWSSSQREGYPDGAYSRYLYYYGAYVYRLNARSNHGRSVRCLRDNRSVGDYLQGVSEQIEAQQSVVDSMQNVLDSLAPVAFSGDYNDLTNTPPIPAAQVNSDWNATSGVEEILNKPTNVSAFDNDAGYLNQADFTTLANMISTLNSRFDSLRTVIDNQNNMISHLNYVIDTMTFHCGTSTVTDHEGNVYATVQIGNQCWMRENLRTTTSPSTGTYLIPAAGTGYTYTGKQAFWYNNDSTTYAPQNYGLLYNWNAAVDTFNTAYGETSVNTSSSNAVSVTFTGQRRGICPVGWHLPSDAEWTAMTDYVSGQSEYLCDSNTNYIAKALADSAGWNSHTGTCAVGNNQSANNATGFSAVPAGYCYGSSFYSAGVYAFFWSSSQLEGYPNTAYLRYLDYDYARVPRGYDDKYAGRSVRCLRDN